MVLAATAQNLRSEHKRVVCREHSVHSRQAAHNGTYVLGDKPGRCAALEYVVLLARVEAMQLLGGVPDKDALTMEAGSLDIHALPLGLLQFTAVSAAITLLVFWGHSEAMLLIQQAALLVRLLDPCSTDGGIMRNVWGCHTFLEEEQGRTVAVCAFPESRT